MAAMGDASEAKMADVTIEEIRTWWKVPAIAHFCSLFRGTFGLPDFEIEELEEALFMDAQEEAPSSFLIELLVRLLRGCYQRKDIDHHNYLEFLRDTTKHRWEMEEKRVNPLRNEDTTFKSLSTLMKVEIMNALCDYRLDAPDVSALKDFYGEHLRIEPLGKDGTGALYWYFYGTRLYKEEKEPTKQEREAKRKLRLKEKKKKLRELQAARRKLKQKEKTKKEKPKKEKESKRKRQKKGKAQSESDDDDDDEEDEDPKPSRGGRKGKNTKQQKSKKGKDESSDEEEEKPTPKKRGKKAKASKAEEEEEEEQSSKKQGRKHKKDTEEAEDKTTKSKKKGRQPKKDEEDATPKKRGKTAKKESKEDNSEEENERTKKKGQTLKKGSKDNDTNSKKRGRKENKEVQTNDSGGNDEEMNAVSADEESDDQPLIKLKNSPNGGKTDNVDTDQVTTPKKRGRAKKVKEEESLQPKKRGRTPKKVKEEEEEKTPTKRSRSKKVKEEDNDQEETTPKRGRKSIKQEPKGTQTPRGKKVKEEVESTTDSEGAPPKKRGRKTKALKEELSEDTTNPEESSTAPSTATSIPVSSEESSDDDLDESPRWHLVCHTEEDWMQLTEKFKKSRLKCERELYKLLLNDFLPEIKALFAENERELRKRLLDMAPRRASDRIVTLRIKQEEEERLQADEALMKAESEARRKAFNQARKERARTLQIQKDTENNERETKRRIEARAKRAKLRERRLEYIREGKEIPEELQKELNTGSAHRWRSNADDDEEETYLGLMKVLDAVKTHPDSWPFLEAVSESYAPGYYNIVKYPMDLTTMERKLNDKVYSDKDEFINDMHQIFQNCVDYNGPGSEYTLMAETLEGTFDKTMDIHFPDCGDSETDDDDFTSADYYRDLRGIRRTPLRHTSRNTSASRAKMEMSVHTMMQSSSAESSPHSSEYEYDDKEGENTESSETKSDIKKDGIENGNETDTSQKDSQDGAKMKPQIFRQETKNFQQGFEKYVSMQSPISKTASKKRTERKSAPKKSRKNDVKDGDSQNVSDTKTGSKNGTKKVSKNETNEEIKAKSDGDGSNEVESKDTVTPETNAVNDSKAASSEVGTCSSITEQDNSEIVSPDTNSTGTVPVSNTANSAKTEMPNPPTEGSDKKPERKKRQYKKRAKKTDDTKGGAGVETKDESGKTNAAEQNDIAQNKGKLENSEDSKPKEKKKRERKKKEPKEGEPEKKPRKRRSKKDAKEAEDAAAKENETSVPTAGANPTVEPNTRPDGNVGTGQQTFVLHKVDCEPGKFSPSIDGHEAKIIRIPNPMHSANMNLPDEQTHESQSHELSVQTDNPVSVEEKEPPAVHTENNPPALHTENNPPALHTENNQSEQSISSHGNQMLNKKQELSQVNQEWNSEPPRTGSVLGQFLNPQEHNFLQGVNMQKDNAPETQTRERSMSTEQIDMSQRVPPASIQNFSPASPTSYYPHQSEYQTGVSRSHDQHQPMMSSATHDYVQQQQQQQQQQRQQQTMIDLNSRRPPHPFQAPPQRHELSQPGLPSAFQRLSYQPNRDSQDGYTQPSVITKVPPMPTSSSSSDHSMPPNTQTVDSGNTSTSDNVFGSRLPQPDQYHGQQFSSQGPIHPSGHSVPPYWDRNMLGSHNHPSTGNYNPPTSSTAPSVGQEQLPERPVAERRLSEEAPTKIWRPHSNGQQDSVSSSSRPPSNVAPSQDQNLETNRTLPESEQGQNKNILGSLLHKSPQGAQQQGSSHPVSPALSSSSHGNRGDNTSHSAFASPRPPSIGGSSSQHPLAGAGSPLQPQTSPAMSQNSLPPQSPHLTDSRVPHSSPPHPLTSPRLTGDPVSSEGLQPVPSSMQGLMREGSVSRGSSVNYMPPMLNSDPSLQMKDYLEAERMRRTPSAAQDLQRYMEMNGSRFGMTSMHAQSTNPYATHAMQQMGQAQGMYGNQLPMPASQPLPASFSSYTAAASPHLRQLLHNRIPGAASNQSSMMSHSAYATQSPLGMGLGAASSVYGGYDRQGPYPPPHGYSMQQAAELQQYYQQHSQALHKQAAGYYQQPGVGSQYLDTQSPNVPPHAAYNPAAMMGTSHLPPGYE